MTTDQAPLTIPEGFTLHTENTTLILLPSTNETFLNPIQEFNRDMSVACIRVWSEEFNRSKEAIWRQKQERKGRKVHDGPNLKRNRRELPVSEKAKEEFKNSKLSAEDYSTISSACSEQPGGSNTRTTGESATQQSDYRPYKFVLLEALSATGLRSIRYAKEIPLVKYVIANDLSPSATVAMKRNVDINGLGAPPECRQGLELTSPNTEPPRHGIVRINEGDACTLMYQHREDKNRVDVVDLDPYGTAAPFIDAAVQCTSEGGLVCVTCTDLSVLATTNYPEKCFSNYGGIPVKAEYCHEAALRLVLHAISTSASRYGRYIRPLLSLSVDFYVRLFIRIQSAPIEVKKAAIKTSTYYICTGCQSYYGQPLGKLTEKVHERSGNTNYHFKTQSGPSVPDRCPECNSVLHMAGPMWSDSIHDSEFIEKVLDHLGGSQDKYGTSTRMKGMLTVAKEELNTPFYFTPAKMAGFFHCTCPPLEDVVSALLHAGHRVSRSHACPGSLKTTATRQDVHDIFRSWVKLHPVKMENISVNSPTKSLLAKEPRTQANFKHHPESFACSSKVGLVRYQQNPTSHWGPGTRASTSTKRKRDDEL